MQGRNPSRQPKQQGAGEKQLHLLVLDEVTQKPCNRAKLILEYTHRSVSSLLEAFEDIRRARGAKRGITTDKEQDLLRAMLVMCAAGVDGMAKQLIRDALQDLAKKDASVQEGLQTFVQRGLRGDPERPDLGTSSRDFLARILTARDHWVQVVEEYIRQLTGGSLQSAEELTRTARGLGLSDKDAPIAQGEVKKIFDIRNQIIHELDVNLAGKKRKRHIRKRDDMVRMVNVLLGIAQAILVGVHERLSVK